MIDPIEIIYDVEALEGTCYVEVKPGKYTGNHWHKESIYFTDETFTYLSLSIEKVYEKYDLLGLSEIDKNTWDLILDELELLKIFLEENPKEDELKNKIGFLYEEKTVKYFKKTLNKTF